MTIYASVRQSIVVEIILPLLKDDGVTEWPIENRFPAEFVATLVDITDINPSPGQGWGYRDGVFLTPDELLTVADVYPQKLRELYEYANYSITQETFTSEALGSPHTYDCRPVDQLNIHTRFIVAKENNSTEPLWANDGSGFKWTQHSSTELLGVLVSMNEHIKYNQTHFVLKKAQLDAALTVAEVRAVVW